MSSESFNLAKSKYLLSLESNLEFGVEELYFFLKKSKFERTDLSGLINISLMTPKRIGVSTSKFIYTPKEVKVGFVASSVKAEMREKYNTRLMWRDMITEVKKNLRNDEKFFGDPLGQEAINLMYQYLLDR